MERKIEKANRLGSTISVWTKIIVGIILAIIGIGTTYYQIESNAADNIRQDESIKSVIDNQHLQFDRMMETMTKEFDIIGHRSDKRYDRVMKETKELHLEIDRHDKYLLEIYKEIWYIKGQMHK